MALAKYQGTSTYKQVVGSLSTFILEGPFFGTFDQWLASIDPIFPNRHVVGHGRYEPGFYTQENSIKLFLLLDTIYRVIASNEEATTVSRISENPPK